MVIKKKKIVILSLPRTGSSTLVQAINLHPQVNVLPEPFHGDNGKEGVFRYINLVHDEKSFNSAVDVIFEKFNCIKHMMHHVPVVYNRELLSRDDVSIVLLTRKNALQKVVSQLISKQVKEWGEGDASRNVVMQHVFEPLITKRVRELLDKNFSLINAFRALMKNIGCNYYDLAYEDLYNEGVKVEDRVKIIDNILTKAGYSPSSTFDDGTLSKLHLKLDHKVKLNTVQTYRLIPNIDEIEERFGSDEVGYLFR